MKYFIISGEASGDKHGSKLANEILALDKAATIQFVGGDMMTKAIGSTPILHIDQMAFMGFIEVVKNLSQIIKNFSTVKSSILSFKPDVIVFIDYPGFNLRLCKWAKEKNFNTVYYITPTIWAWHTSRVHDIKKYVDVVIPILPFEPEFFKRYGVKSHYCGNPVKEEVSNYLANHNQKTVKDFIALLPGSRNQEIHKLLPVMIELANAMPHMNFQILKAPNLSIEIYQTYLQQNQHQNVQLTERGFYNVVHEAKAAVVTSGTATLETALLACPQVVVYKTSAITYKLAKWLVDIKYISLVNILTDEANVVELIQQDCNLGNLLNEVQVLLQKQAYAIQLQAKLNANLGEKNCSQSVAKLIIDSITSQLKVDGKPN